MINSSSKTTKGYAGSIKTPHQLNDLGEHTFSHIDKILNTAEFAFRYSDLLNSSEIELNYCQDVSPYHTYSEVVRFGNIGIIGYIDGALRINYGEGTTGILVMCDFTDKTKRKLRITVVGCEKDFLHKQKKVF